MGMLRDMKNRLSKAQIDSALIHNKIEAARRLIFEKGHAVRSAAVSHLLDSTSLMPIRVCFKFLITKYTLH